MTSLANRQPSTEAIEAVSDYVESESCKIPEEFLQFCKWLEKLPGRPEELTKQDILQNLHDNVEIYTQCFVWHNEFVKTYNETIKRK